MVIAISFIHPYLSKIGFKCLWMRTVKQCNTFEYFFSNQISFNIAFNKCITTEFHLYKKGEGFLLRVLDKNGYYLYDAKVYIDGDESEKEDCISFIRNKAILQKIFEG